jgi:diguanylate cyclase (GGDEF)-like protein
MVEQKRTQLFMALVQQAGVGALPLSHLTREQFLNFMRKVERAAISERSPIIVYWSSRNSKWLLPDGAGKRQLMRDSFCISVFSEERDDKQEEFCFLIESQGLCLTLYGHRTEDQYDKGAFQCVGSIDPDMVRRAFQMMLPVWQFLDLGETNRLEDARNNAGTPSSSPKAVQELRTEWSLIKPPTKGIYMPNPQIDSGEITLPISEILRADRPQPPAGMTGGFPKPSVNNSVAGHSSPGATFQRIATTAPGGMSTAAMTPDSVTATTRAPATPISPPEAAFVETAYVSTDRTSVAPPGTSLPDEDVTFVRAELQTAQPPRREKRDKNLKGLREVWTSISAESRTAFPPDAQRIIRDMFGQLRHSSDHSAILQLAIEEMTKVANADRGLIWQVVGDQLTVTNEFALSGHTPFVGEVLGSGESSEIISEFLLRFPDESGAGVIAIPDTMNDTRLHKMSQTLASLIELGEVRARLVAQLRCIGRFHGFIELQQSRPRMWSEGDAALLQSCAETLSVVVQQGFDLDKREQDAREMKLINTISELFRESKGQRSKDTLTRSVKLVAEHMGFIHSQIYLVNEEEQMLVPQIAGNGHSSSPVRLSEKDNPYVQVCEGKGKVRMINVEYTRKGDVYFGHDTALVVPLESEGETLGVLGLWGRDDKQTRKFRPGDDPKLAQTICNNLASIIRADQAIAQIRADRAREQLINRVSQVIRQSPKDVDQILETLIEALCEHLGLGLCVVSLYDGANKSFIKSKVAGDLAMPEGLEPNQFAEALFKSVLPDIGKVPIFPLPDEINLRCAQANIPCPKDASMITIAPLIHRENLKAALCLVSCDGRPRFPVLDMNMIMALAERVAVDIAHKELFEQVERQAVTDPMTGLYNRRHFSEQLSKEIDRNQRFGHPFSYIILDLDFLKKINDSLGHQFGDAAIKHIANVIKKCVRDVDTTARYGGEEFVVLLPETDVGGARVVAERMCVAIAELPVDGIGTVTASIGVATFPYDAQDRDKLTELADQALYLAKHRGRNQVCSVSDDLTPSLEQRGEEALEIQKATIKAKAEELDPIDLKLVAEHGLLGILGAVIKMIEAKDAYANDRSPRAVDYAAKLAQALHLSREHTTIISLAAILHNIGKIGIPEEILQKKEALTDDERKLIQQSPTVGAKLLEPAKHLHRVASVVEAYHEHWDGTGYPKGLRGEQIPLESRIIALIDAYVAMTSERPYRAAMKNHEAAAILQAGAAKEWDPRLVKLFLAVLQKESRNV